MSRATLIVERAVKHLLILALGIFLLSSFAYADQLTWTGTQDNKWNNAANWNPQKVPTSNDDVTIGNSTVTVTGLNAGANTVSCAGTLIIDGTLRIAATSSFTTLTLMSGALIPDGTATISGPLTLSGGSINNGAGDVNISGTTTVTLNGTLGTSGTVTNTGTITIGTAANVMLSVGLTFVNNGTINIQSDGVNAGLSSSGGTITNNKIISKNMGTGTSQLFATVLNNAKTISASTGTLQVWAGSGFCSGNFDAGATLEFAPGSVAGDLTLTSNATLTGAGTIRMTGTRLTLIGTVKVSVATFLLDAGAGTVIDGTESLTVTSPSMKWNSGTIAGSGTTATLTFSGAKLEILTTGNHSLSRNMDLQTTLEMSGDLTVGGSATVTIEPGATFNILTDNNITGQGAIQNGGTFEKTGGTGTSTLSFNGSFSPAQSSAGTVSVTSGVLDFAIQGTSTVQGTWNVTGFSSTLQFSAGTYNLGTAGAKTGVTFAGTGLTSLTDATWNVVADSVVNTGFFEFMTMAGTIQGSANLTVKSKSGFSWVGGNMAGSGATTIPKGVKVSMSGSPAVNGRTINNSGKITFTSATNLSLAGMTWNNLKGSTFNFQDDGSIVNGFGGTSIFNNAGTVEKTGGAGFPKFSSVSFNGTFNNGGKVEVTNGTLLLDVPSGTSGGGNGAASFVVKTNKCALAFGQNNHGLWTINSNTSMSGKGAIGLNNGVWNLTAPLTVNAIFLAMSKNASITGKSNLTILAPTFSCDGGTLDITSPGGVTVGPGVTITPTSSGCTFDGSTIDVQGILDATQGSIYLGGSTLNLDTGSDLKLGDGTGVLDAGAPSTLNIKSILEKANGNGTSFLNFNGTINLVTGGTLDAASGTIEIGNSWNTAYNQSGGTTEVTNGAVLNNAASSGFNVTGGTFGGSGSIFGPINITSAILGAGTGTTDAILTIDAPLTLSGASTVAANISGTAPKAGTYDQINSTSSMALNGTLSLNFGSNFSPATGQSFTVLNYSAASGNFSSIVTPSPTCVASVTKNSTSLSVTFTSNNVSVAINPTSATLKIKQQQQFTDTVTNGCGNGVTWSVQESGGGTVTQSGLYTAPGTAGTYHVVVTSQSDPTKSATATVTVTTAAGAKKLAVTPQAVVVQPGGKLRLQANATVNWTVVEGPAGGAISANGTFTASSVPGLYHVMATSSGSSTEHAVANIAVVSGHLQSAYVASLDTNSVAVLTGSNGSSAGQLQQTESLPAGQSPAALAISPDGKYLLSANRNSNDVSLFAIAPADGSLSAMQVPAMDTGTHPSAIAFDSGGRFAFVANHDSDDLSLFALNSASGQIVSLGKQALAAGDHPAAIAVHPFGPLLFAANSGSDTVAAFSYDATGTLKPFAGSPFPAGHKPSTALIDATGKFLFVANRASADVSVFAIDAKNESLMEISGSPFAATKGAAALALDVTGTYVFVAGHEASEVAVFQVNGESGALSLLGRTALKAAGPASLAVDPSGQYLYVTSDQTGGVTTLQLDVSSGRLTQGANTQSPGKASSIAVARGVAATAK